MDAYLIVVIVLAIIAIGDLWVGVANTTNFLVGAIGSKAATYKTIIIVAAVGLLVGVSISGGMMEVARKGIVHPEMFYFKDMIIIFFAYAIGDIILLDLFNTFGMPTSTTVSMVFGLVGSGTVISLLKITDMGVSPSELESYVNTSRIITMGTALVMSVLISFIVGGVVQYLSRLLFTFDYEKRFRRWGAIWSSAGVSLISYFIVVKGLANVTVIPHDIIAWLNANSGLFMLYSFIFWTGVFELLILFTKVNVLKCIVLFGTAALAMAFAANDLVNFIGVPLAAIDSYKIALESGHPFTTHMFGLNQTYAANPLILLAAGAMMVFIMVKSKKMRTVLKISVELGSQSEEVERFQSNPLARSTVRAITNSFETIKKVIPMPVQTWVNSRFDLTKQKKWDNPTEEPPAFDLVRGSVNLIVSASLISLGTSFTLPLSTTYVGFIVAMSSAFSDRAWGRDSAAGRLSGVLTVIGGWFFTAIVACINAALIALLIWYTGFYGMAGMCVVAGFITYKNSKFHKKREKDFSEMEKAILNNSFNKEELYEKVREHSASYIHFLGELVYGCAEGIEASDLKMLKTLKKISKEAPKKSDIITSFIAKSIKRFDDKEILKAHYYSDIIGNFNVLSSLVRRMIIQSHAYFDNNHRKMTPEQIHEIKTINYRAKEILNIVGNSISEGNYFNDEIDKQFQSFKILMNTYKAAQAKRLHENQSSSFQNLLYLSQFDYCERLVLNSIKINACLGRFFSDDEQ